MLPDLAVGIRHQASLCLEFDREFRMWRLAHQFGVHSLEVECAALCSAAVVIPRLAEAIEAELPGLQSKEALDLLVYSLTTHLYMP